ncbi:MAG: hypothetical protein SF028_04760 [Candidatus Sumerlaeia bacterium]|nr:hypothetical protein [Candidatus Sumerlaeia bacterium]
MDDASLALRPAEWLAPPDASAPPAAGWAGRLAAPCLVGLELRGDDVPALWTALARVVAGERSIHCLDSSNRFDPYRFSNWAREHGVDPMALLERVFLSRAFTIHQFGAVVEELLPPLLASEPRPLVVLLGADELFLDEQVPRHERRHVFASALRRLERLRARGLSMLATVSPAGGRGPGVPDGRPWRDALAAVASPMVRLERLPDGRVRFAPAGTGSGSPPPALRERPGAPRALPPVVIDVL